MTKLEQEKFSTLAIQKLSDKEQNWLAQKKIILAAQEGEKKFPILFSLVSRFVAKENMVWTVNELQALEDIYPGFSHDSWTRQDVVRVIFMMDLDTKTNATYITQIFETAEVYELIALFKGLYLLENAAEFRMHYEEGIRTNMVNVFDAISAGNPFAKKYLPEASWNQLILKTLFIDRKLYKVHGVDAGKNENLANMLQDFVMERWAAGRTVSLEMWRMLFGFLREDVKKLIANRNIVGNEKKVIDCVLHNNTQLNVPEFWDEIGKLDR